MCSVSLVATVKFQGRRNFTLKMRLSLEKHAVSLRLSGSSSGACTHFLFLNFAAVTLLFASTRLRTGRWQRNEECTASNNHPQQRDFLFSVPPTNSPWRIISNLLFDQQTSFSGYQRSSYIHCSVRYDDSTSIVGPPTGSGSELKHNWLQYARNETLDLALA